MTFGHRILPLSEVGLQGGPRGGMEEHCPLPTQPNFPLDLLGWEVAGLCSHFIGRVQDGSLGRDGGPWLF